MDSVVDIKNFCRMYYQLGDAQPSKAQENNITKMLRDGKIKGAFKVGRKWFIDIEKLKEGA